MRPFFILIFCFLTTISFSNNIDKIEPSLLDRYEANELNSVIIILKEKANVSHANLLKTKLSKAKYVVNVLQSIAKKSQRNLILRLKDANINFKSFYITNAIQAKVSKSLLLEIADMVEVEKILNDAETPIHLIRNSSSVEHNSGNRQGEPTWGIQKIKADSVWLMGIRGEGVIVGGQDTGFDYDLDLLVKKYRGFVNIDSAEHNYNWHDAIHEINPLNGDSTLSAEHNPCGVNSIVPCDDHGHGSHTMGTMVGGDTTDVIGVAPDAKWIACRNMERGWGKPSSYIECFEWFMNPTDLNGENADISKAPHVINNSWGCPEVEGCNTGNFSIMDEVVNNIKASGVVVVVSAGNSGSSCETITTPSAIFEGSFTVGATRSNDTIAGFSSRGAVGVDGSLRMKPNISAPGVGVRSCIPGNKFGSWSGTSMAGPHVAGVVALMISANPSLAGEVDIIESIIEETADPKTSDQDCSGLSSLDVPNVIYGHGRINALKAVLSARDFVVSVGGPYPLDAGLQIFPNPVKNELNLFIPKLKSGMITVNVYNIEGKLVKEKKWVSKGLLMSQLTVSDLNNGIYLCHLKVGGKTYIEKFIKQ